MRSGTVARPAELFKDCFHLSGAATSADLKSAPRHRWFYFPHSFSYQLIDEIFGFWELPQGSTVLDNFVGSGTTLLAAREKGMHVQGFDISPLAVTISNTKINTFDVDQLSSALTQILQCRSHTQAEVPERLQRAFTPAELSQISKIANAARDLPPNLRDFFAVALLSTSRSFSRAVPDGGWFRWKQWPDKSGQVLTRFRETALQMIEDVKHLNWDNCDLSAFAKLADARSLPIADDSVDALVTSPPYPNRHDYSRIFHIDLLLLGLTEEAVTNLRHHSLRSNVEARPPDGFESALDCYSAPPVLTRALEMIEELADPRIVRFLRGYFQDTFLAMREAYRVLRPQGLLAYVVGNVRHAGVMIPVDQIVIEIATEIGFQPKLAWVIRHRGNSAQQMGVHGRIPSRESVVFLSKSA